MMQVGAGLQDGCLPEAVAQPALCAISCRGTRQVGGRRCTQSASVIPATQETVSM
jgi:hypothetical protein